MKGRARGAIMALGLSIVAALPAAARENASFGQGARYVAMGSSFASGSGVAPYDPGAPVRCQRSMENYAHQLARKRNLVLVDVTCGGATTAHVLGSWNELPPQIEAVTADTALVTITIGGNDIGYIGGLIAGSCGGDPQSAAAGQPLCQMIAAGRRGGAAMPTATEAGWTKVGEALAEIVQEVRRRAPRARIVFVDYLTVLPEGVLCGQTPLSFEAARDGRAVAERLRALTEAVARRNGARVLAASRMSKQRHDACAANPWVTGFVPPAASRGFVPYHPNLAGMTAVAEALDRSLDR